MINMKALEELFNKSEDQYSFYLESLRHLGILYLDNDSTFFVFDADDKEEPDHVLSFDWYLGNASGLINLLSALNLRIEEV